MARADAGREILLMLEHAPRFTPADAARIARELYGIEGTAQQLTSERDQNFQIDAASGTRIVLKIANAIEDRTMLDAQTAVLAHLATRSAFAPKVVPAADGALISEVAGPGGRTHHAWAVTHLPGIVLSAAPRRSPALLEDLGTRAGELSAALATFDHPAIHREFHWDLATGSDVIAKHRALVADEIGRTIDTLLARFNRETAPALGGLRRSAIHNDLNDNNVLVAGDGDLWSRRQHITGFVDFGDMVFGYTVADLAVACAYVMLDTHDPLGAAASVVRGYHAAFPLHDDEIAALFGLIVLRLCLSATLAAHQQRQNLDNAYLDVSQAAIRAALPVLATIPFGVARAAFRNSCGLEPVVGSERVTSWLRANTANFAPVVGVDLRTELCVVLDLSIGSPLLDGDSRENAEHRLTPRVEAACRDAAGQPLIGIGRYDEARYLYTGPAFAPAHDACGERRAVHIGLDLFAPAGTSVLAPLDGVIHAFAYNAEPEDYGHVIVLRHTTDDDTEFFTLYGHLSRESIDGKKIGQRVVRGEQFASFGAPDVNGGWTPHLHLQIMIDALGLATNFPGVAAASQRATWLSLCPDPNTIVGVPADRFPPLPASKDAAVALRRRLVSQNLSVAYREPVRIVRGWKQYLFDDDGRRYLDAYNNVPHVGHAQPRVVRAAADQMRVLSTNTRYLNDGLAKYAERLTATLPDSLSVCVLLNSASEANELAVRMARAYTQVRDMIVLEAAYHGNTNTLIDLSPYKHAGPGGSGAPDWVHVAPIPDDYRGEFRRGDPNIGAKYAARVSTLIDGVRERGRGLAGFIAETCPSVGGQIMLPTGYLEAVYASVRAAGGVCIADEVQTGLGRIGSHFWAFDAHGVVPDIVVMGKPLGNGHPLAAVVTTRAIADAFDNGMEFFSTFGGNNVSCAAGLAVLDVMRDEALQEHALRVGERLIAGLTPLANQLPLVGDVRGSGLFLGVELVRDRETREPATEEAAYVANRMREEGILLGTDGPHHNVVKIRPPMPFDRADADRLVDVFDRIVSLELA
ncbi:MAG: aminotransferase class III-fold pyridoxal phosphate-dependent enzyme [Gemmatimonadetes bacterium]|nr:aminotransferase class III-fold pyridoxal phosphate-dependent enzyme [Gemmatimonadota bacterium]